MGLVTVTDQNGNPPPINDGCGQPERLFVQFVPLEGPFANGTPMTDRFTDNLGKIGTEGIPQTFGTQKFQLRCNEANVNPNYETARVVTSDLEHDNVLISVRRKAVVPGPGPTPPPGLTKVRCNTDSSVTGLGTPDELRAILERIVARLPPGAIMEPDWNEGGNGKQPTLKFIDDELHKVHPWLELQNSERGEGYLKPREFGISDKRDKKGPPESPCGQYSRPFDFGAFGFAPFCNATSTNEWNQTGRPPSSQW